jgi:hypothetical protein
MYSILAALVAAAPATGDEFPKEKLFTVIGVAAAVVVILSILSFVLSKKKDDDDDDDNE